MKNRKLFTVGTNVPKVMFLLSLLVFVNRSAIAVEEKTETTTVIQDSTAVGNKIVITYSDNLLSINANSVTLKELCKEISDKTGVEIVLDKEIEEQKISIEFDKLSIKNGIEKILDLTGLKNLVINYKEGKKGYEISKIEISKRSKEEMAKIELEEKKNIEVEKVTKSEPQIENLGKVLFLEIIEENWDEFDSPFLVVYRPTSATAYFQINKKVLRVNEREINLKNKSAEKPIGFINNIIKFNGKGRNKESGSTSWLYELPYKLDYEEYKFKEGKGYFGLTSFFYVKALKQIRIQIQAYDNEGNLKLEIILGLDKYDITLKPMEIWESKMYTIIINPKEYISKYTSKEDIVFVNKEIEDWKYKISENVKLLTRINIKNYGFVNSEMRILK